MFIDTHCHIHNVEDFRGYSGDDLLKRANDADVQKIIVIGTSHRDSLVARDFAHTMGDKVFWTYGVHPSEFEKPREDLDFDKDSPVAIGEVGLDYHYGPEFYQTDEGEFAGRELSFDEIREQQIKLLEEMLDLAIKNDLPVSFHVREAFDDFFGVIANFPKVRGVIHSFSDNKKNLAKVLDHGFYVGVNGMATYSTLPLPPLDRTLTETDAPYLAPVPHRHELNEPAYIPDIARWLAEQHRVSIEEVAEQVAKNAKDLFGI